MKMLFNYPYPLVLSPVIFGQFEAFLVSCHVICLKVNTLKNYYEEHDGGSEQKLLRLFLFSCKNIIIRVSKT